MTEIEEIPVTELIQWDEWLAMRAEAEAEAVKKAAQRQKQRGRG